MKRGGQMTLSLGGSMRLVPASRSPLAVPAATGQPDAEGPMEQARQRSSLRSYLQGENARAWLRDSFILRVQDLYSSRGPDKSVQVLP